QTRVGSNCRYMVYVHSKLMIIDDEFLLIGSANLNERSLAGDRDAEVGIYLRAGDGQLATCKDAIKNLRRTAWTRLLGSLPSGWESPNQPSCIADIQTRTTSAYVDLRLRVASPCRMISFPFYVDDSAFYVRAISLKQEDPFIVDAPVSAPGRLSPTEWMWGSPLGLTSIGQATDLGE
ncbi:MAG TPA: phospholipase D-like domain-containing protein, partial [Polyangiaceae bacterium]|nr:phospholipase D-like domain-containing protein [Polyangiaceae bacterium]